MSANWLADLTVIWPRHVISYATPRVKLIWDQVFAFESTRMCSSMGQFWKPSYLWAEVYISCVCCWTVIGPSCRTSWLSLDVIKGLELDRVCTLFSISLLVSIFLQPASHRRYGRIDGHREGSETRPCSSHYRLKVPLCLFLSRLVFAPPLLLSLLLSWVSRSSQRTWTFLLFPKLSLACCAFILLHK